MGHEGNIGRIRTTLPHQDIFGNRQGVVVVGGVNELALTDRLEASPAHQTARLVAANIDALCSRGASQTPAAIALLAGGESGLQIYANLA
jgi:hypothetical protein